MKKSFVVVGICIFLIGMPLGLSDCGCDQDTQSLPDPQSGQAGLSDADIEALREQGKNEGWTFTINANPATKISLNRLCGLIEPDNWRESAKFNPCTPTRDLPEQYDWRDVTGCPPIRDQGSCGSCWAFSTIGALECAIKINESIDMDLSEQWLVSCNRENWGCQGGWYAHNYLEWKTDSCAGTGAVPEEDFPYVAEDAPCDCPYRHVYKINDWAYIGDEWSVPSVEAIKTAIMEYGPVSVGIAVTSAFQGYSGGVFNQDDPDAEINHAVVLVGWDDNQGTNGVWFLRNSWSPYWGEDGYMNIEYGVLKVGYAACFIDGYSSIAAPETSLSLEIAGGIGVTIKVQNTGEIAATDVQVSTTITGGLLGLVNLTLTNENPVQQPDALLTQQALAFGVGSITIQTSAYAANAGKETKETKALLIGIFVIITAG